MNAIGNSVQAIFLLDGWESSSGEDDGGDRQWYSIMVMVGEGETPSAAAVQAVTERVMRFRQLGAGDRVLPHSDIKNKTCPGPHLTTLARQLDRMPMDTSPPIDNHQHIALERRLDQAHSKANQNKALINRLTARVATLEGATRQDDIFAQAIAGNTRELELVRNDVSGLASRWTKLRKALNSVESAPVEDKSSP